MVKGLENFREYFSDLNNCYVLIGGAACSYWMETAGFDFRATKDLDVILVIEVVDEKFIKRFWKYVKEGQYQIKEKSSGARIVYRFSKPKKEGLPSQIELFSRKPDLFAEIKNSHLTPIPVGEYLSSLSAILMNDEYYQLAVNNSKDIKGLRLANLLSIICLKVKAVLDIKSRLENLIEIIKDEEKILNSDLKKHIGDIIRLTVTTAVNEHFEVAEIIKNDLRKFLELLSTEGIDYKPIFQSLKSPELSITIITDRLKLIYWL